MSDTTPPVSPSRARELADAFPEINPGNYGDQEVTALNNWGIEAHAYLRSIATALSRAPGNAAGIVATLRARAEYADVANIQGQAADLIEAQSLVLAQRDAEVAEYWTLYRNANARAEAAEALAAQRDAEVARLKGERTDIEDDYLRRHNDAVDQLELRIAAEASEARLRAALEQWQQWYAYLMDQEWRLPPPPDICLTPTASGATPVDGGKTKPKSQGWNPGHGI